MIFNLFKSKPTLKELIPKGFVDIHSHILPGIDDGAKNIDESIHLIGEMKKLGFSKIIATPHTYPGLYENTNETIIKSFNLIKSTVKDIKIDYASEYLVDMSLNAKAEKKNILSLKKNFVLIEFSFASVPNNLFEIIFKLQHEGYKIILAHPERYSYFYNSIENFKKLKKYGCYFQLNLFSTIGYYGSDVIKHSDRLLKSNLIDFVGTDLHNISQLELFSRKIKIKEIKKLTRAIKSNIFFK